MNRRSLIGGLLALAAPAVIRTPGLLMPVRARPGVWPDDFAAAFQREKVLVTIVHPANQFFCLSRDNGLMALPVSSTMPDTPAPKRGAKGRFPPRPIL